MFYHLTFAVQFFTFVSIRLLVLTSENAMPLKWSALAHRLVGVGELWVGRAGLSYHEWRALVPSPDLSV